MKQKLNKCLLWSRHLRKIQQYAPTGWNWKDTDSSTLISPCPAWYLWPTCLPHLNLSLPRSLNFDVLFMSIIVQKPISRRPRVPAGMTLIRTALAEKESVPRTTTHTLDLPGASWSQTHEAKLGDEQFPVNILYCSFWSFLTFNDILYFEVQDNRKQSETSYVQSS